MKRVYLSCLFLTVILPAPGQRALPPQEVRDQCLLHPKPIEYLFNPIGSAVAGIDDELDEEAVVGETFYDLQSNAGMQNRIYAYEDGTIGTVFTMGFDYMGFPDLGTGYNYFDGNDWGPYPMDAIEDERSGWPSYSPWGENGEIVVSHYSGAALDGLAINSRAEKGTGEWSYVNFEGPDDLCPYLWPRAATGGVDHSVLHLIALTTPVANGGIIYEGMDGALLYSRSTDGGVSWEQEHLLLDGINSNSYLGFGSDTYEIQARGDVVAFVAGDEWTGLVLMKSADGGGSWEKTVIWDHPYPLLDPNGFAVTDTFYTADGCHALAIDATGKVHVAFGISRSYMDNGQHYWFPAVDGIGYWNEDRPAFSNNLNALSPYGDPGSELGEDYSLIGWSQDIDGDGEVTFLDDWGQYYCGISSMPQLIVDDWNRVFLVYASVTETYDNGTQNYRHIWARASSTGGESWGNFVDLTNDLIYIFSECVFPSLSQHSDEMIHLVFQEDSEPGIAVRGDLDPYGDNHMVYMGVWKEEPVGEMGHLAGIVTDEETGEPIENALVEVTGTMLSDLTQPDGSYFITIGTGTFDVACSAMGYYNGYGSAEIIMGDTTILDFQLEPATGLDPPQELVVSMSENDAVLGWDVPATGSPLDYKVYRDGELLVSTALMTFTDEGLEPGMYEYFVTACYADGESGPSNIVTVTTSQGPCYDFDDLVAGEGVVEQLGGYWTFASSAPGQYDATVVDENFHSPPNSFEVGDGAGIVFQLGDEAIENGSWEYSHNMYVPSSVPGYFSVHSDPNPSAGWILEVNFTGDGSGYFAGSSFASFNFDLDTWFLVRVILDLDNGIGRVYFDQDLIEAFEYAGSLGSITFWGNNQWGDPGSYFDDVCFDEGEPIQQLLPPTNLEAFYNGDDFELSWNAPGGGKEKAGDPAPAKNLTPWPVDKDPSAKVSVIPSEEMFDLLFDFTPQGQGEAGIEVLGDTLYTCPWNGGGLYKYDKQGNLVDSTSLGGYMIRDLATNGFYFYGGAASTTMFEFDPATGMIISTFSAPANIRGLAYDDEENVFYGNNWSDNIVKFDMSGANLGSFPVGPYGGSYYGFAIDNFGEEKFLWAHGQTGETLNELVQIALPNGNETGVYFDVGSLINPGGTGVAGGLACDDAFVEDHVALIGCMQGISLWGLELAGPSGLLGYNVYYSWYGEPYELVGFTTETHYDYGPVIPTYGDHCFYVTALYDAGESDSSNIVCEFLWSVGEQRAPAVSIWPNPAKGVVNIKAEDGIESVLVYDLFGRLVIQVKPGVNEVKIGVGQLPTGIYLFKVESWDNFGVQRVVIE